jgi:RHS repeat-associated protein
VEEIVNGAVARQYTDGLQLISQNQIVNNAWTPSFYEDDGSGSIRPLTNTAGAVTDSYEYDAFGDEVNSSGTTPNNYLYPGERYDPDLNLYYLRARYYNPLTGRFLSAGPLASEGQRRYEYANADPVDGIDPSGNEAIIEWALLTFYPGRLGFISAHFPSWCGLPVVGTFLPGCGVGSGGTGGTGPGPGGPPKPPKQLKQPCTAPNCCKKCFETAAFASEMDSITQGNDPGTTGKPNDKSATGTYCSAYVSLGLQAGEVNIFGRPGYAGNYGSFLEGSGFEAIASYPHPTRATRTIPSSKTGATSMSLILDGMRGRSLAKKSWSMDEVQRMVIEPDEITSLVREMNLRNQKQEEVDWYTCMAILFDRYPGDVPRTFCINERMQAFLPLMEDKRIRGWTSVGPELGCNITNEAIFRAVARCPLRADEEKIWFDPDESFRIALEESKPERHA